MTARMQKSGGTGHSRAEMSMALLKEKCCPQTVAGERESGVRSPGQEEKRLVQSQSRDFPPSCGFCVESLSGNMTRLVLALEGKAKSYRLHSAAFQNMVPFFPYRSSFDHWKADIKCYIRCIALLFFHFQAMIYF